MKKVLIVFALLNVSPFALSAGDGLSNLFSALFGAADENKARQKRYERRYEIMMVRDAKRGRIPQLRPVDSPVAPIGGYAADSGTAEKVSITVKSLVYDENIGTGILKLEINSGAFKDVNDYIYANIGKLVRNDAPGEDAPKVPPGSKLEIESMSIREANICDVLFTAKASQ